MYKILLSSKFKREYFKLVKRNHLLKKKYEIVIRKLRADPFDISLGTHKINVGDYVERYSVKVTGDLRIIWCFDEKKGKVLLLLSTGGHSGGGKLYR